MKLILVIMMLFALSGSSYAMFTDPVNGKGVKELKKTCSDDKSSWTTNFHSIKKMESDDRILKWK